MSTRSLTRVFNNGKEIACIYRQCDGYPSGHGAELAKFVSSRPFVNGISDTHRVFNGMGCFAAQLVSHLKGAEAGNIYLYAPGTKDVWEEFVYEVHGGNGDGGEPIPVQIKVTGSNAPFSGSPAEFVAWCSEPAAA